MASPHAGDDASGSTAPVVAAGDVTWYWEYCLRKYLMLLATMVGTITYAAGFTPPGGVWQDTGAAAGRLAGDPIILSTSYRRYLAFYYTNAAAFASSLVIIVLILILTLLSEKRSKRDARLVASVNILRCVMVLDLFSLIGAYVAGTCRDRLTSVYSSVLVCIVVVYVGFQVTMALKKKAEPVDNDDQKQSKDLQKQRKMLMLLATFAVSVTYLAGLNAPGGFWDNAEGSHRPGVAILKGRYDARLAAFFVFNTTAFVASLLIIVRLLDSNLRLTNKIEKFSTDQLNEMPLRLYIFIILVLVGLVCAYATGSCRKVDTSIKVSLLVVFAVLVFIIALLRLINYINKHIKGWLKTTASCFSRCEGTELQEQPQSLEKARSLVLLLATLAATIAYQAGLDPPGGLWEEDGDGYLAGDPILLTTNPRRYKAFFFCNSVAFVASLLAIILVKLQVLLQYHALEAAMILDLFGLIGAYATGACRDMNTSIYAIALAGAVLVYVVIHVVFFTLDPKGQQDDADKIISLEKRRKRLLLFAILGATIAYQAGLTPPSGFWLQNEDGPGGLHRAGDPVLLYNYPRRYRTFFYCNTVSFMLSIALIILLVNPNIYRPAIRSNALSVCTAAGMISLVCAYAAGSTQHLKTSLCIFGLVVAVLIAVLLVLVLFSQPGSWSGSHYNGTASRNGNTRDDAESGSPAQQIIAADEEAGEQKKTSLHSKRKYLMLLGILAASITYQAGLKPPGGTWQNDGAGHTAGDPIMYDNRRLRYQAFFYINSTSFVASVIVIVLLLVESMQQEGLRSMLFKAMNTTIALDLFGLLLAYAVGSSRSWKTSVVVLTLVVAVLVYVGVHVLLSSFYFRGVGKNADERKTARISHS